MFGLDQRIAGLGSGEAFLLVVAVAVLLGLRHATDPDHLTALGTLVAGDDRRSARRAGRLGLAWGLGHATTLFVFGVPIVLFRGYLPETVQQVAELARRTDAALVRAGRPSATAHVPPNEIDEVRIVSTWLAHHESDVAAIPLEPPPGTPRLAEFAGRAAA